MLEILMPGIAGCTPKIRAFFKLVDWTVQRGFMEFNFDHEKSKKQRLFSLLRSDAMASDSELSDLQTTIASAAIDLARYSTEIKMLQQTLNRLVSEHDALLRYSGECRSLFAPVRRLPRELLAEIFALGSSGAYLCCDDSQSVPAEGLGGQLHLLPLLQVCSTWYNTIMAAPSLWANIAVDLDIAQPGNPDSQLFRPIWASIAVDLDTRLSRSLARSGQLPLTIKLTASIGRGHSSLELLAQCAERWRFADLYLGKSALPFLWRVSGNLPHLERLALGGDDTAGIDFFATAPSLTRVVLSDINGALPKLPWSQLREMTYYASQPWSFNADGIADRLAVMSHCQFVVNPSASALITIQSDIPVLRLAVLDREGEEHSRAALGEIIGVLTLPNLRELLFRSSSPNDDPLFWPREQFPAFASRSSLSETLTKLFLYHMVITEDELAECLSETKLLQELFIQDVPGDADFEDEEHILITNSLLQRLAWRSAGGRAFTIEAFSLIESEPEPPGIVGHGLGDGAIARMDALKAQGRLRWARYRSKHFEEKFPGVYLF
ncbi:hypothetical protein B0H14DRAFT_2586803 [Mycena olivaceomarginata]|nr:hypothetical protein B0H14DRAFT_2586803 [Mycena olivaceomarginata]